MVSARAVRGGGVRGSRDFRSCLHAWAQPLPHPLFLTRMEPVVAAVALDVVVAAVVHALAEAEQRAPLPSRARLVVGVARLAGALALRLGAARAARALPRAARAPARLLRAAAHRPDAALPRGAAARAAAGAAAGAAALAGAAAADLEVLVVPVLRLRRPVLEIFVLVLLHPVLVAPLPPPAGAGAARAAAGRRRGQPAGLVGVDGLGRGERERGQLSRRGEVRLQLWGDLAPRLAQLLRGVLDGLDGLVGLQGGQHRLGGAAWGWVGCGGGGPRRG